MEAVESVVVKGVCGGEDAASHFNMAAKSDDRYSASSVGKDSSNEDCIVSGIADTVDVEIEETTAEDKDSVCSVATDPTTTLSEADAEDQEEPAMMAEVPDARQLEGDSCSPTHISYTSPSPHASTDSSSPSSRPFSSFLRKIRVNMRAERCTQAAADHVIADKNNESPSVGREDNESSRHEDKGKCTERSALLEMEKHRQREKKLHEILACLNGSQTRNPDEQQQSNKKSNKNKYSDEEEVVDLWHLRNLALTRGGLLTSSIRKRAWPKIVGVHEHILRTAAATNRRCLLSSSGITSTLQTVAEPSSSTNASHASTPQVTELVEVSEADIAIIKCDVGRSVWHIENQIKRLRAERYDQGLDDDSSTSSITTTRRRFKMGDSISPRSSVTSHSTFSIASSNASESPPLSPLTIVPEKNDSMSLSLFNADSASPTSALEGADAATASDVKRKRTVAFSPDPPALVPVTTFTHIARGDEEDEKQSTEQVEGKADEKNDDNKKNQKSDELPNQNKKAEKHEINKKSNPFPFWEQIISTFVKPPHDSSNETKEGKGEGQVEEVNKNKDTEGGGKEKGEEEQPEEEKSSTPNANANNDTNYVTSNDTKDSYTKKRKKKKRSTSARRKEEQELLLNIITSVLRIPPEDEFADVHTCLGMDDINTKHNVDTKEGDHDYNYDEEEEDDNKLHYYQGLHDLTAIFLINLESPSLTSLVLSKLSTFHLRDAMRANFHCLQTALKITFPTLLLHVDREVHDLLYYGGVMEDDGSGPCFAVSWIISWFAHDVVNVDVASRLVDVFLCSHALMPIYLAVALLTHPYNRTKILETDCDFTSLHIVLCSLPRRMVAECKKSDGGGDSVIEARQVGIDGDSVELMELFEEMIEMAIAYMREFPPQKLVHLARLYCDGELVPHLKLAQSITLINEPPSWALAAAAPTDWSLLRQMKAMRSKRRSRQIQSAPKNLNSGGGEKLLMFTPREQFSMLPEDKSQVHYQMAMIAAGVGHANEVKEKRRRCGRHGLIAFGLMLILAATSFYLAWVADLSAVWTKDKNIRPFENVVEFDRVAVDKGAGQNIEKKVIAKTRTLLAGHDLEDGQKVEVRKMKKKKIPVVVKKELVSEADTVAGQAKNTSILSDDVQSDMEVYEKKGSPEKTAQKELVLNIAVGATTKMTEFKKTLPHVESKMKGEDGSPVLKDGNGHEEEKSEKRDGTESSFDDGRECGGVAFFRKTCKEVKQEKEGGEDKGIAGSPNDVLGNDSVQKSFFGASYDAIFQVRDLVFDSSNIQNTEETKETIAVQSTKKRRIKEKVEQFRSFMREMLRNDCEIIFF